MCRIVTCLLMATLAASIKNMTVFKKDSKQRLKIRCGLSCDATCSIILANNVQDAKKTELVMAVSDAERFTKKDVLMGTANITEKIGIKITGHVRDIEYDRYTKTLFWSTSRGITKQTVGQKVEETLLKKRQTCYLKVYKDNIYYSFVERRAAKIGQIAKDTGDVQAFLF